MQNKYRLMIIIMKTNKAKLFVGVLIGLIAVLIIGTLYYRVTAIIEDVFTEKPSPLSATLQAQNMEIEINMLNSNFQKWENLEISHYRFSFRIGCLCEVNYEQPLTNEVLNGEVVSSIDNKGVSIAPNLDPAYRKAWYYADLRTLDGLFNYLKHRTLNENIGDHVDIEYDVDYGFPKDITIWNEDPLDEPTFFTVSNFEVLP